MASEDAVDGTASPPLAPPPPPPPPLSLAVGEGDVERLTTPTARRSESIASQFQREIILGELAQTRNLRIDGATGGDEGSRDDIEIDTPETFATKSAAVTAASTAAASKRESDETSSTERTATQVAQAIADAADEAETEDENDYDTQDEQSEPAAADATAITTDDADIRGASTPKATATTARFVSPPRITRRTTLSPAKASLLLNENQNTSSGVIDDSAISRRDTVSPAALKSLLQSISLDDESPSSQQKRLLAAKAAAGNTADSSSESESKTQDERTTSSTTNQFLASSSTALQTPESVRKTRAMKRKEREERTLSPSEVLSMTMSEMVTSGSGSSNSTSAGKSKRSSSKRKSISSSSSPAAGLDGNSSVISSDSFTDTFFSSKLVVAADNSGDVENSGNETEPLQEEEDEVSDTPRKKGRSDDDSIVRMSNSKGRRTTLEPTDAADFLSELRQEMQSGSKHTNAKLPPSIEEEEEKEEGSSEVEPGNRRQTLAAAAESDLDPSPMTRSKSRRATVDPSDIFSIVNGTSERSSSSSSSNNNSGANQSTTRRETLNVEDLYEINPEFASRRKRKQQHDSDDEEKGSPDRQDGKKARANDDEANTESPPPDSIVSITSKAKTGLTRPQKTPTPRKQQQRDEKQPSATRHSARLQERETTTSAEFASPTASGNTRIRTPLKSILSARKPPKGNGQLTTPTKSVNFGPPEGAEFNLGSPSTSMTPMLAKDARRMFPLDRITTPPFPVEEDDEETSLNTSLLDEADAIDSGDDGEQKEGFEGVLEASNSRLSFLVSKSAEKNHRRYSLRGVSPLDNQANARRQRRNSMSASVLRTSPVSARKLKGIGPGALANLPAPPPSATKSSFLSSDDAQPQGRLAYADSSASSDAGEDMEITGDFSNFVQAGGVLSKPNSATSKDQSGGAAQLGSQPSFRLHHQGAEESRDGSLFADSPLREETVELGSLGDLVAESAAYDTTYPSHTQRPTTQNSSDEEAEVPTLGNLSDLAREDEQQSASSRRPGSSSTTHQFSSSTVRRFNSLHYSNLDEQDVTLDPIMEEEEDAGNSSVPSMMSIASSEDEESDSDTYDARRKSLVVNLSSKFERIGSGTPKAKMAQQANTEVTASVLKARITSPLRRSPRRKSQVPAVPLISMDELLATTDLQSISDDQTTPDDRFEELYTKHTTADPAIESVKLASVADACEDVVKSHIDEISSWSTGLSDVLGSLLSEKAPALFSPQNLDEAGMASIKALYELETVRVQSGWCQWRAKMEREIVEKLQLSVAELENDVDTLKSMVAKDTATKQSELAALQELIEREKQMAELLDAIEEQQSVRNEYAATVDVLETHCASLSLEASVLHDQLRVVEGVASEGNHISAETSSELERQVLDTEELAAIQGSLSVWRIAVATSSHLKLSAQFDDVVVCVDLQVDVVLHAPPSANGSSRGGGFSTDVSSCATLKRRRQSQQYLESEKDIVHLVQQKLFDPVQLSRFVRTASSTASDEDLLDQDRPGRVCALLQELERSTTLAFRFLREIRALSTQFALEFIVDAAVLWVEFLNFTPSREAKFVVGFAILDEFPFTSFETSVHVVHGPVSPDEIRVEIEKEEATQNEYEYITRVCERLRNTFVTR
ncbi:hypothetical protein FI667_g5040, partial [Globisporangium splendens]